MATALGSIFFIKIKEKKLSQKGSFFFLCRMMNKIGKRKMPAGVKCHLGRRTRLPRRGIWWVAAYSGILHNSFRRNVWCCYSRLAPCVPPERFFEISFICYPRNVPSEHSSFAKLYWGHAQQTSFFPKKRFFLPQKRPFFLLKYCITQKTGLY
jgi:hypothetical protein